MEWLTWMYYSSIVIKLQSGILYMRCCQYESLMARTSYMAHHHYLG